MNLAAIPAERQGAFAVRRLAGLSGANVLLLTRDERHWFIRKIARDQEASARLRRQAAKQRGFGAELGDVLRTPPILDDGEVDGRYYFDMEFVRGADAASYLRQASYAEVISFGQHLDRYLQAAAVRPPLSDPSPIGLFEAMYVKVCEVQQTTEAMSSQTMAHLLMGLNRLRQLGPLSPTLCHGDLTLENMVVDSQGGIWAVDLLDSPFEHYWQDLAKLHQDLVGGWYLSKQSPIAKCVLDHLSRRLLRTALKIHPRYAEVHAVMLACTFVRILPYTVTDEQRRLVLDRINNFARLSTSPDALFAELLASEPSS